MGDRVPIAIVGLGGVFPGALDLDTFWRNIAGKVDATRSVPPGRWIIDPQDLLDPQPGPDKTYSDRACFVEGFSLDPAGLNLDPDLLRELDPLYSLVLHVGRHAYQEGVIDTVNPQRVGVMLAATCSDARLPGDCWVSVLRTRRSHRTRRPRSTPTSRRCRRGCWPRRWDWVAAV
jgi:acyl transferase domain-containing protein